ncbi:MAG: hypothetical protein AAFU79_01410, partial [Myxococcota bacterium]
EPRLPAASAPVEQTFVPSVGLNLHFTPRVQLKSEAAYYALFDLTNGRLEARGDEMFSVALRLVVSF